MRIRPVLSNLTETRRRNGISERDRKGSPLTIAFHKSKVNSVQKDSRLDTGHALVRGNWMGATKAPGWM
jgi:hypothetical protein